MLVIGATGELATKPVPLSLAVGRPPGPITPISTDGTGTMLLEVRLLTTPTRTVVVECAGIELFPNPTILRLVDR